MANQKKYEFTGETKIHVDVKLHRIRALVAIAAIGVAAGDLGGWIEKEANLSQDGNAWVSDNARVLDNAWVSDNAWVFGNARVTRKVCVLLGFPHTVTVTDHHIAAGCEMHPPSVWKKRGAAIIKANGHSAKDAKAWAAIINQIAEAHGCVDMPEGGDEIEQEAV
jgi:hypothetical protein